MKLNLKNYKIEKTKKYLRASNLLFFVNGISQNSLDWLFTEQGLKTVNLNCYKVLNKTTIKTLNSSIYTKISQVIKGSTFLIKPQKSQLFLKQTILNSFNLLFLELLILKLNNKIYSANSLNNTYSLSYRETKLLLYQFNQTSIKAFHKFSK